MPKILNIKAISIAIALLVILTPASKVKAQCNVVSTNKNNVLTLVTEENLQYIRTSSKYFAFGIKSILVSKPNGNNYQLGLKYMGPQLSSPAIYLLFTSLNGQTIQGKVTLLHTGKTDNKNTIIKQYSLILSQEQLELLKEADIQNLSLKFLNSKVITIPVNDPAFIKTQLNCLQNELILKDNKKQ